ncbi:hypothetical protein [Sphingopyxis macrogoltabida]|nr:hypothetical protein [Sphingopyxis macrogoltabida]
MSGATDPAQAASADDNTPPPIIRKVANRIMWWLIALYFVAILDRGNVAYAAVPMSQALGLSTAMFGFGVGIMYLTYSLFEVPSNMMGSVAKIVKLEHAWRRLDGRNDDGFQVAPFPG